MLNSNDLPLQKLMLIRSCDKPSYTFKEYAILKTRSIYFDMFAELVSSANLAVDPFRIGSCSGENIFYMFMLRGYMTDIQKYIVHRNCSTKCMEETSRRNTKYKNI